MDAIDRFREAGETHDIDLAMTVCADDVVVHSPLTDRATFRGRAEVRGLFEVVYEQLSELRYSDVLGDGRRWALFGSATVGGQRIEETLRLTLDDAGQIVEVTLYIRPLPGLAAVMAALGPPLARRYGRSRLTAAVLRAMVAPLVFLTRAGDRAGIPLALPESGRPA
ncbi:MAG: nuclear transport factor 2 family protein [Actinophytocola sp.]|uniref:nuclear transport factor 2 family protein n=1 Tax=Actinophytocola sp. TaxID=1872138 RepID=UPI001326F9A8|nr:nuclear transport factor 2 family protein [Actinophytocola sp.]MPZ79162.1 nuclear transport factor 2 family protein [Actinophytocola sp.]